MRSLLILSILFVLSHAKERLCIEALSVENKTDISKDFIRKLSKISWAYEYREIEGKHKIFIGDFTTRQEAEKALPSIQDKLNKEAFVTVLNVEDTTESLSSQAKMQKAALMAKAKMITKPVDKKEEKPSIEKEKIVLIDIVGPQEKKPIQVKTKVVKKQKVKVVQNIVCKPSKKALRETEISDALEFYKNSSFYKFNAN